MIPDKPYIQKNEYSMRYPSQSWDGEKFSDLVLPRRRIIDAHVHCLFDRKMLTSPDFKKTYGYNPPFEGTIPELVSMMQTCDVEKSVILTGGVGGTVKEAIKVNERISQMASNHPWLIGFGYAPADGKTNVTNIVRQAVDEFGLKGLGEIFPITGASDFKLLFEAAHLFHLPVIIDSFSWTNEDAAWFKIMLPRYHNMHLIFAHMGQNNPEILELGPQFPNVYFDMSVQIHFYEARVLEQIKYLGSDKVVFATDFPATAWTMYDDVLRLERMPLPEEDKHRIFYQNMAEILGLYV